MRFHPALLLSLSLAVASLRAQPVAAGIEFNGVLLTGGKTSVSLFNSATGEAGWVAVGRKFGGRTVTAYNPADAKTGRSADTVVLTRDSDGRRETITLKGAQIVPTQAAATPASTPNDAHEIWMKPPPGARLRQPLDPNRPTEFGQVVFSEKSSANGKVQFEAVTLQGYNVQYEGADIFYQPIYSSREMILAPENVAAVKIKELDSAAKLKETVQQRQAGPIPPPQSAPPAKAP